LILEAVPERGRKAGNGSDSGDFHAGIVICGFFNKHPMPATE
jgi:hypothetical protein